MSLDVLASRSSLVGICRAVSWEQGISQSHVQCPEVHDDRVLKYELLPSIVKHSPASIRKLKSDRLRAWRRSSTL